MGRGSAPIGSLQEGYGGGGINFWKCESEHSHPEQSGDSWLISCGNFQNMLHFTMFDWNWTKDISEINLFSILYIVTYSGFSIHDGTLLHSKSQYTTVKTQSATLGTHVHVRPARSRNTNSYRILPTGPVVAIFQHSLPFLQSESFQTHVGTIHRPAIGPLAHHNGTSAYSPSLTCTNPDNRMSSSSAI
jgi:hypothetical protein